MPVSLQQLIIDTIKSDGPLSFRNFMDLCLYHPELGYYTAPKQRIGCKGDYYTSSSLTPAFGYTLARQMEEMWRYLGGGAFTIIECGAGDGRMCNDMLHAIACNPDFYKNTNVIIVEKKNPSLIANEHGHKIRFVESLQQIHNITGCIVSNELMDNLPVHIVEMGAELMEVFIDYADGNLCEVMLPASQQLRGYVGEMEINLPPGCRTEVCLDASEWLSHAVRALRRGYALTIDYGYTTDRNSTRTYYDTLVCYHSHTINDHPCFQPGDQDITAHVNFSALQLWGEKMGLSFCGYTSQANFLLSLGFADVLNESINSSSFTASQCLQSAFIKHTLLTDMGNRYKVLIQGKRIPGLPLSGMRLEMNAPASARAVA